ncbi:MAG: glycosyltransferase family 4 protein [Armatimonadota bacterium]|jgi:glycosyltransferase involved in cell wall biosynthesis
MKILHIGSVCGHGGTETVMATLIQLQRQDGVEADAFFFADCGGSEHFKGICPVYFANHHSLTELLMSNGYDLVHVISGAAKNTQICLKRAGFNGAVIESCHGTFTGGLVSDCITAVSKYTASSIQPKVSQPVEVIPNGIDVNTFSPKEAEITASKPIIAWIGRYTDVLKDFDGVIALANTPEAGNYNFIVVDGAPEEYEYANWLPKEAVVLRRKPWREMPKFYRDVRSSRGIVLSTSRLESFGLSLIEAGACGCPVVAPKVGGIGEVVQHKNTGYLYERSRGTAGLIEALNWIRKPENYDLISENAIKHIKEHFSASRMWDNYKRVYEIALSTKQKRKHYAPALRYFFFKTAKCLGLCKRGSL